MASKNLRKSNKLSLKKGFIKYMFIVSIFGVVMSTGLLKFYFNKPEVILKNSISYISNELKSIIITNFQEDINYNYLKDSITNSGSINISSNNKDILFDYELYTNYIDREYYMGTTLYEDKNLITDLVVTNDSNNIVVSSNKLFDSAVVVGNGINIFKVIEEISIENVIFIIESLEDSIINSIDSKTSINTTGRIDYLSSRVDVSQSLYNFSVLDIHNIIDDLLNDKNVRDILFSNTNADITIIKNYIKSSINSDINITIYRTGYLNKCIGYNINGIDT